MLILTALAGILPIRHISRHIPSFINSSDSDRGKNSYRGTVVVSSDYDRPAISLSRVVQELGKDRTLQRPNNEYNNGEYQSDILTRLNTFYNASKTYNTYNKYENYLKDLGKFNYSEKEGQNKLRKSIVGIKSDSTNNNETKYEKEGHDINSIQSSIPNERLTVEKREKIKRIFYSLRGISREKSSSDSGTNSRISNESSRVSDSSYNDGKINIDPNPNARRFTQSKFSGSVDGQQLYSKPNSSFDNKQLFQQGGTNLRPYDSLASTLNQPDIYNRKSSVYGQLGVGSSKNNNDRQGEQTSPNYSSKHDINTLLDDEYLDLGRERQANGILDWPDIIKQEQQKQQTENQVEDDDKKGKDKDKDNDNDNDNDNKESNIQKEFSDIKSPEKVQSYSPNLSIEKDENNFVKEQNNEAEKAKDIKESLNKATDQLTSLKNKTKSVQDAAKVATKAAKTAGVISRAGAAIAAAFSNPVTVTIIIILIILLLLFLILISINTRPATETAANDVIRNSMSKLTTGNLIIVTYPKDASTSSTSYNAAGEIQIQPKSTDGGRNIYEFKFVANYQIDLENFINKIFYGASGLIEQYRVLITKIQEKITFNSSNVEIRSISFLDATGTRLSASPNYTIETDDETGLASITWNVEKSGWDSSISYPCKMNQNSEKKCTGDVKFSIEYVLKNNPSELKNHMFSVVHEVTADVRIIKNAQGAQIYNYSLPSVSYTLCRNRAGGVFLCSIGSPGLEDGEDPWAGVTIEGVRNEVVSIGDLTLACPLNNTNDIRCTAGRNYPKNLDNAYAGKPHNALDLVPNPANKTVYIASEAQRIKINNTNPKCGATVILYNDNLAILYAHVDGDAVASTSASFKNAMDQQNKVVEINELQVGGPMGWLKEINGNTYFSNGTLCATGTHLHFTILKTDGTPTEGLYDKVNEACGGKISRCPDE
ncbi:MAG: hypothetical protein N3A71_00155 [Candidatus Dojkabacteria bacterium]|nr:hypothetical protein [Candidatus Dojkabacteria bacterium]